MEKNNSFSAMLESVAALGDDEKRTIKVAIDVSDIIDSISSTRVALGLTQRQVADKAGIKQSALARMESLRAIPKLDTVVKVARCLGLSIRAEKISVSTSKQENVVYLANYQNNQYQNNKYQKYQLKHNKAIVEGDFANGSIG